MFRRNQKKMQQNAVLGVAAIVFMAVVYIVSTIEQGIASRRTGKR